MLIFLTLCYVAVLAILVKLKIVELTTFWKLSPILWFLLIFCLLFIPMQWGAPSGPVSLYQMVTQITPNVSGPVEEVHIKQLEQVKKGDLLFTIDETIYKAAVDNLKANLHLAKTRLDQSQQLAAVDSGTIFDVQRYQAEVDALSAQLNQAEWNLESTRVRAPSDGYVLGMTLQPGARVANMPISSVMAFVNTDKTTISNGKK